MNEKRRYLDHGYVRYLNHMGTDADIVRCARQSYDNLHEEITDADARRLIYYLMEHRHMSPFEMCELQVEIQAPLFVVQQLLRHRTASINQLSMRYTQPPDEDYIPEPARIQGSHKTNKQGSGEGLSPSTQARAVGTITRVLLDTEAAYQQLQAKGVANEISRIVLPAARYTRLVWKANLRNVLHMLRLRLDEHSQLEIREMAARIEEIVKELWPIAYAAWVEFDRDAVTFSASEIAHLRESIGDVVAPAELLGSPRRAKAFLKKIGK